ncbi:hypothetical protein Q3G72_025125 [Acer saccharum]|nr:hypothetical protein Q3G72_025125 [Acer saccharum]
MGPIPSTFSLLTNLEGLYLFSNQLTEIYTVRHLAEKGKLCLTPIGGTTILQITASGMLEFYIVTHPITLQYKALSDTLLQNWPIQCL